MRILLYVFIILIFMCCGTRQKQRSNKSLKASLVSSSGLIETNNSEELTVTEFDIKRIKKATNEGIKFNLKAKDTTKPITFTDGNGTNFTFTNADVTYETYSNIETDSLTNNTKQNKTVRKRKKKDKNSIKKETLNAIQDDMEVSRDFNWGWLGWLLPIAAILFVIYKNKHKIFLP